MQNPWEEEQEEWEPESGYPVYHVADPRNRERIRTWGLQPGAPSQHGNYEGFTNQPKGVYVHQNPTAADWWEMSEYGDSGHIGDLGHGDIWEINPDYIDDWQYDDLVPGGTIINHEIPPEALKLIDTTPNNDNPSTPYPLPQGQKDKYIQQGEEYLNRKSRLKQLKAKLKRIISAPTKFEYYPDTLIDDPLDFGDRTPWLYHQDSDTFHIGVPGQYHSTLADEVASRTGNDEFGDYLYGALFHSYVEEGESPDYYQQVSYYSDLGNDLLAEGDHPENPVIPGSSIEALHDKFGISKPNRYQDQNEPMKHWRFANQLPEIEYSGGVARDDGGLGAKVKYRRPFIYNPTTNKIHIGLPSQYHFEMPPTREADENTAYGYIVHPDAWLTQEDTDSAEAGGVGFQDTRGIGNSKEIIRHLVDHLNLKKGMQDWDANTKGKYRPNTESPSWVFGKFGGQLPDMVPPWDDYEWVGEWVDDRYPGDPNFHDASWPYVVHRGKAYIGPYGTYHYEAFHDNPDVWNSEATEVGRIYPGTSPDKPEVQNYLEDKNNMRFAASHLELADVRPYGLTPWTKGEGYGKGLIGKDSKLYLWETNEGGFEDDGNPTHADGEFRIFNDVGPEPGPDSPSVRAYLAVDPNGKLLLFNYANGVQDVGDKEALEDFGIDTNVESWRFGNTNYTSGQLEDQDPWEQGRHGKGMITPDNRIYTWSNWRSDNFPDGGIAHLDAAERVGLKWGTPGIKFFHINPKGKVYDYHATDQSDSYPNYGLNPEQENAVYNHLGISDPGGLEHDFKFGAGNIQVEWAGQPEPGWLSIWYDPVQGKVWTGPQEYHHAQLLELFGLGDMDIATHEHEGNLVAASYNTQNGKFDWYTDAYNEDPIIEAINKDLGIEEAPTYHDEPWTFQ